MRGLSPCIRGYQDDVFGQPLPWGSIPAYAGLPGSTWASVTRPGVHPRVCGVTSEQDSPRAARSGLSPRVRVYRSFKRVEGLHLGSIPTHVGLPVLAGRHRPCVWVYPRVYGATDSPLPVRFDSRGLSPCVRGYRSGESTHLPGEGSIPVHTGLPRPRTGRFRSRGVYPRVYGATSMLDTKPSPSYGLSPCIPGYNEYGMSTK